MTSSGKRTTVPSSLPVGDSNPCFFSTASGPMSKIAGPVRFRDTVTTQTVSAFGFQPQRSASPASRASNRCGNDDRKHAHYSVFLPDGGSNYPNKSGGRERAFESRIPDQVARASSGRQSHFLSVSVFDEDVSPFDGSGIAQRLPERRERRIVRHWPEARVSATRAPTFNGGPSDTR
jgi:hypothetical protein